MPGLRERIAAWLSKAASAVAVIRSTPGQIAPVPDNPEALLKQYREWVYACVTKNAEMVSSTPLRLYTRKGRRTGKRVRKTPVRSVGYFQHNEMSRRNHLVKYFRMNDTVVEVLEHPFLDLWDSGNPFMTGAAMQRMIVSHMDIVGDSYVYIDTKNGVPIKLHNLPPELMSIKINADGTAIQYYEQRDPNGGTPKQIPPECMMHTKHPDPRNAVYGMSPLESIGLAAQLYHQYNQFEWALLNNDGVPGTIITTEVPMTETQERRIERKWYQKHGGPSRAGKIAFVSAVKGIERIGFSQRDMAFQAGRKATREDIAGAFNVPISLLVTDGSALAKGEDAEKHHARYGIKPRLTLIEQQINRDIMPLYDGGAELFVAFDDPVPDDRVHNLERSKVMLGRGSGIVRKNEARLALELPPEPELEGEYIESNSLNPITQREDSNHANREEDDDDEKQPEPEQEPSKSKAAKSKTADRFRAKLQDLAVRQRKSVLGKLKSYKPRTKAVQIDLMFDVEAWTNTYYDELVPDFREVLMDGVRDGAAKVSANIYPDIARTETAAFIGQYTYRFAAQINSTTQTDLRNIFAQADANGDTIKELTTSINDLFAGKERWEAERIARTETARARQAGEVEAWRESHEVAGYHWIAVPGECDFCKEIEFEFGEAGRAVSFGGVFASQGDTIELSDGQQLSIDYSDIQHPPLHPHCRCYLEPVFFDVGE